MPTNKPLTRICCLGEVMVELATIDAENARIGVAGDTYNTAVYLQRELTVFGDTTISYVTALGDDRMSHRITQHMRNHGIDTGYVEIRSDRSPGMYAIETDDKGERSFSYWRDSAAARTLFQQPATVDLDRLLDFDLIYLSGISLAILPVDTRAALMATLGRFRDNGGLVAFDSNYRPRLWSSQDEAREVTTSMWSSVDVALPSLDDEQLLFGDENELAVLSRLKGAGVRCGALKRGHVGPVDLACDATPSQQEHYAAVDSVLDTTAAGDSFNAGWLAAFARGENAANCMRAGHALASQVVCARGAVVPTLPVLPHEHV